MENNKKKFSFGYEDTDKSIEIDLYGLIFKANVKNKDIEELKNIRDDIELSELEEIINKYLGRNAVEKINRQRKLDGYNEIDEDIATQIILCIIKAYTDTMLSGFTDTADNINRKINDINDGINNITNMNREQRRNYSRNQYRGNRRNYRRY